MALPIDEAVEKLDRCISNAKSLRTIIDEEAIINLRLKSITDLRKVLDSIVVELEFRKEKMLESIAHSKDPMIAFNNIKAMLSTIAKLHELTDELRSSMFVSLRKSYYQNKVRREVAQLSQNYVHLLTTLAWDDGGAVETKVKPVPQAAAPPTAPDGDQFMEGYKSFYGIGRAKNLTVALKHFQRSVEDEQNPDAMLYLSDYYLLGLGGVGVDMGDTVLDKNQPHYASNKARITKAFELLDRACSAEHDSAEGKYRTACLLLVMEVRPHILFGSSDASAGEGGSGSGSGSAVAPSRGCNPLTSPATYTNTTCIPGMATASVVNGLASCSSNSVAAVYSHALIRSILEEIYDDTTSATAAGPGATGGDEPRRNVPPKPVTHLYSSRGSGHAGDSKEQEMDDGGSENDSSSAMNQKSRSMTIGAPAPLSAAPSRGAPAAKAHSSTSTPAPALPPKPPRKVPSGPSMQLMSASATSGSAEPTRAKAANAAAAASLGHSKASSAAVQRRQAVLDRCVDLFFQGAEASHAGCQRQFGLVCELIGDYEDAERWYTRACHGGDADAYNCLGLLYHHGVDEGALCNNSSRTAGQRTAAGTGAAAAVVRSGSGGEGRSRGYSIAQDHDKAFTLFLCAANAGCSCAYNNIGLYYELGIVGRESNIVAASGENAVDIITAAHFRQQHSRNSPEYDEGISGGRRFDLHHASCNLRDALHYYSIGATMGSVLAMYNLGYLLIQQYQINAAAHRKQLKNSLSYDLIGMGGSAGVGLNSSVTSASAAGVQRNDAMFAEGFKWLRKAADYGYLDASFQLGVLYESGGGAPRDYHCAYQQYCYVADFGRPKMRIFSPNELNSVHDSSLEGVHDRVKSRPAPSSSSASITGSIGSADASMTHLHARAAWHAGRLIHYEKVPTETFDTMMEYILFAALHGVVDAVLLLGEMYYEGDEVNELDSDVNKAVLWYYEGFVRHNNNECLLRLLRVLLHLLRVEAEQRHMQRHLASQRESALQQPYVHGIRNRMAHSRSPSTFSQHQQQQSQGLGNSLGFDSHNNSHGHFGSSGVGIGNDAAATPGAVLGSTHSSSHSSSRNASTLSSHSQQQQQQLQLTRIVSTPAESLGQPTPVALSRPESKRAMQMRPDQPSQLQHVQRAAAASASATAVPTTSSAHASIGASQDSPSLTLAQLSLSSAGNRSVAVGPAAVPKWAALADQGDSGDNEPANEAAPEFDTTSGLVFSTLGGVTLHVTELFDELYQCVVTAQFRLRCEESEYRLIYSLLTQIAKLLM